MINLRPDFAAAAIQKFLADAEGLNHRYRSWDHCYLAFRHARDQTIALDEKDKDLLSLHLSCYLSSWGMLRNSFLLNRDYRAHLRIVDILLDETNDLLWSFPSNQNEKTLNAENLRKHWTAIDSTWNAFTAAYGVDFITDTLVSKILLGTCGCIPATDRLYKKGVGSFGGTQYFGLNSYSQIVRYYWSNWEEISRCLEGTQLVTQDDPTTPYPPMKLMDMCFWQIGSCIEAYDKDREGNPLFSELTENEQYAVLHDMLKMSAD
jgi:hypothetical protein